MPGSTYFNKEDISVLLIVLLLLRLVLPPHAPPGKCLSQGMLVQKYYNIWGKVYVLDVLRVRAKQNIQTNLCQLDISPIIDQWTNLYLPN